MDEMAGKKKTNLKKHVEKLMIKIDLEEQTRITDQVKYTKDVRNAKAKQNQIIVMEKSELFNKLVSSITSTNENFNNDPKHNVNIIELRRAVSRTKRVERPLRIGKQQKRQTTQSIHTMIGWPTNSKTNNGKQSENYLKSAGKSC